MVCVGESLCVRVPCGVFFVFFNVFLCFFVFFCVFLCFFVFFCVFLCFFCLAIALYVRVFVEVLLRTSTYEYSNPIRTNSGSC